MTQCTVHTVPAHAPVHAHVPVHSPAPIHFILYTERCTLHTMCLYCILQIYHFTLQTSKIGLGWTQDLHG